MVQPVFAGLVFDESGNPADVTSIGDEPCYVINDAGFKRHIPANDIDRQVLQIILKQIEGNEQQITEQTAKMLGQDDPFSKAFIHNQIKNIGSQFDQLIKRGIPEEARAYIGMMGFRIIINFHGEIIRVDQPAISTREDD